MCSVLLCNFRGSPFSAHHIHFSNFPFSPFSCCCEMIPFLFLSFFSTSERVRIFAISRKKRKGRERKRPSAALTSALLRWTSTEPRDNTQFSGNGEKKRKGGKRGADLKFANLLRKKSGVAPPLVSLSILLFRSAEFRNCFVLFSNCQLRGMPYYTIFSCTLNKCSGPSSSCFSFLFTFPPSTTHASPPALSRLEKEYPSF